MPNQFFLRRVPNDFETPNDYVFNTLNQDLYKFLLKECKNVRENTTYNLACMYFKDLSEENKGYPPLYTVKTSYLLGEELCIQIINKYILN